MLVVLTKEPRETMFWVRRELFAACLKYMSYGNPIPIVIEHGATLHDLTAAETDAGHLHTPLHRARDRLIVVPWQASRSDSDNLAAVEQGMRDAVRDALEQRTPTFLRTGLRGVAEQFFYPAIAVLGAGIAWLDPQNGLYASLMGLALLVLFTDLGGYPVVRLLPRWAGGLESRRGWYRRMHRSGRPGRLLTVLLASSVMFGVSGWDWALITAALVGIALNLVDSELWGTVRLRERLTEREPDRGGGPT